MHLLIITPIYPPTTGGAATYYGLLTSGLLASGAVTQITIITESLPGHPRQTKMHDGRVQVIRMFPHRAGTHLSRLALYLKYAIQNLQYALLPALLARHRPNVILVHSSLHIYFNTLRPFIKWASHQIPVIADVRDQLLAPHRLYQLEPYTALIVCSENVRAHVLQSVLLGHKVKHIPVIQEPLSSPRSQINKTLVRYGLDAGQYFLFAGLIKAAKGLELLLGTYDELRARGHEFPLVIAGMGKDYNLVRRARNTEGVRVIGAVPRQDMLDLLSGAMMNINLSESEGMPRSSLEALALGTRVLLPAGIPEFDRYCANAVVRSSVPHEVAKQIEALLTVATPANAYPIALHEPQAVLNQYQELFASLLPPVSGVKGSKCRA